MERVQTCTLLGKCKVRSGRAEEECGRCAQEERGRGTQETLGARAEGACAVEGGFAVLVSVREDVTEGGDCYAASAHEECGERSQLDRAGVDGGEDRAPRGMALEHGH